MRVFVTGATGFIGSALVPELIDAGHTVLGMSRSEEGAAKLRAAGAEVLMGNLDDPESLRRGAADADGVIHLAFNHDFSQFEQNAADERAAIAALGEVLLGTQKPLIITSGTAIADNVDGQPSTEESPLSSRNPRRGLEEVVKGLAERGVVTSIVRLSQIHDNVKQGLVPYVTAVAKQKGVSAYLGDGSVRWPACPVASTAQLYRLALEKAEAGAIYHAVDEEGVSMKDIAEAIGRGLNVPVKSIPPEQSAEHFGWLAMFAGHSMPSSSALTQRKLGWKPQGPSLIEDLDTMDYSVY